MIKNARNSSEKLVINFVANRVKQLRLLKNWTQEELANESEVSLAQIKRIELGLINPSLLVIYRISLVLGLTLDEFFNS